MDLNWQGMQHARNATARVHHASGRRGGKLAARGASATTGGMRAIGFLSSGSPDAYTPLLAAFRKGLAEAGYVEGRNVAIEFSWAEGKFDRLPALASDLVQRSVTVIATTGTTSALAAKAATATIPLVFLGGDDPVKFGLVASLNRPGGNATGLNLLTSEMTGKRLELARELVPAAAAVAVLINPKSPEAEPQLRDVQTAARAIGQPIHILNASTERDVDTAFATLVQQQDGALLVTNDAFFMTRSNSSSRWRLAMQFPRSTTGVRTPRPGVSSAMELTMLMRFANSAFTPQEFSMEQSRPICRSSSRRNSNW